jgi:amidase
MLDVAAGADLGAPYHAPPKERPFVEEVGKPPGSLRIAVTTESLYGRTTHPDCKAAVERTIPLLEDLGHRVVEARPPFDRDEMVRSYLVVVASSVALDIERAEALARRKATPEGFEPATWLLGQIGRAASALDLHRALEARHMAWRRIAAFFEEHDVLLTPTLAYPPARIGEGDPTAIESLLLGVMRVLPVKALLDKALSEMAAKALEKIANTMLFNMTGQPAVSLPLHWNDAGLPIGVQLAGRFGAEGTLLRLGAQLEEARPWRQRRPPLEARPGAAGG